ncbi:hypothetical protein [Rheinheimera mangrovi]|uniref:hypothetical protein n=1 Tax=Rheinheimera mangrovi TaxID=2498451 RepID=UPI00197FD720|nr:hypothetical protein [Rheinheimera mangrovi]
MVYLLMSVTLHYGVALLLVFAALYRVAVDLLPAHPPTWHAALCIAFTLSGAAVWLANLVWAQWNWYFGQQKQWLLYLWSVALLPLAHFNLAAALLAFTLQLLLMHLQSKSCVSVALPVLQLQNAQTDPNQSTDQKAL